METRKVDKRSPIPIYYQLKNIIREKIESGEWKPGDRIPSIPELSRYHEISQMTARQSISELCDDGLLYSIQGKGTFVAKPKIARDLSYLSYFTDQIAKSGFKITTTLLNTEITEAPEDIAEKLEIEPRDPVILVHRLREIEGEPFYLETSYFSKELCEGLLEKDLSQHSLHFLLENHLGYQIDQAVMTIEAVGANSYQGRMIRVKRGTPLLSITQITYLADNRPIQFVRAVSRSDKFKYSLKRRSVR